jgi:hypothetical protein
VFDPASIVSFQGRPIVDDHPDDMVGPDYWQEHAISHVMNVRRGDPPDDDVLLSDLVFTSRRGIELVRNGKRRCEPIEAVGTAQLDHAGQRFPWLRVDGPGLCVDWRRVMRRIAEG